jgi:ribosomal protein L37AE/L43A
MRPLKPAVAPRRCPFCGEPPKVRRVDGTWDCYCNNDACAALPAVVKCQTRAGAVATWNTRKAVKP